MSASNVAAAGHTLAWPWQLGLSILPALVVLITRNDPGLTVDEPINVGHGKRLAHTLFHSPGEFLRARGVDALWRNGHEHPPLCRTLIGLTHAAFDDVPHDPAAILPKRGRAIGALALAVIVWLCMDVAGRFGGRNSALAAWAAVITMPRLFAHAHLASPEVISSALFLAGLRSIAWRLAGDVARVRTVDALTVGSWLGVALLAKLTNVLLLPIALATATIRCRGRGLVVGLLSCAFALFVFVGGWPWLWPFDLPGYAPGWLGTIERLREFFGVGLRRATIYVEYFGVQYPTESERVPWHYTWVFFATTIPLLTLTAGVCGMIRCVRLWRCGNPRGNAAMSWMLAVVGVLAFFTLPIEKYDGERIMLFVFPPFAVLAGLGLGWTFDWLALRRRLPEVDRHRVPLVLATLLALAFAWPIGNMVSLHPVQLSYFSSLVGGLPGAERLGLEVTYWGDSLVDPMLDRLAESLPVGSSATLLPTLYAGHAVYLVSPQTAARKVTIQPQTDATPKPGDRFLVFRRAGYLQDHRARQILAEAIVEAEFSRQGIWLARLLRWPDPGTPSHQKTPTRDFAPR